MDVPKKFSLIKEKLWSFMNVGLTFVCFTTTLFVPRTVIDAERAINKLTLNNEGRSSNSLIKGKE